jgi:5-methylthioadenosine/S-adenosylhomocysteine deaminase
MSMLLTGGTIVTGNDQGEILRDAAIVVERDRISRVVSNDAVRSFQGEIIDVRGFVIIPGFVQTHVHLCQTLFRGMADDLLLLDWLKNKIFPFEAAHTAASIYHSTVLGIIELIRSGTTTILDMGSIHYEEEIIRAIGESGLRAVAGKAMMDVNELYPRLRESTQDALTSTRSLIERWHNSYDGRVHYAVAPRFVLSCSDELLHGVREMMTSFDGVLLHTHASENTNEVDAVRMRCKMENIEFLHRLGLLSSRSCLAHCIHLTEQEIGILSRTHTHVAHCPSSNLKLASGIAKIPCLMDRGINVSLGADGAPCNNSLDMFQEMRLASLIQKPVHGPTSMPAKKVFNMATMAGAKALNMERELGSIEEGKKADLVLLNINHAWDPIGKENIYSSIVYSAGPENVDSVMIDGEWIYRKKEFTGIDVERIIHSAQLELDQLLARVELS